MRTLYRVSLSVLIIAGPTMLDLIGKGFSQQWGIFLSTFNAVWVSTGIFMFLFVELSILGIIRSTNEKVIEIGQRISQSHPVISKMKGTEFYGRFLTAVKSAQSSVWICYFQPVPPNTEMNQELKSYYTDIYNEMKRNSRVNFKRIILDTEENRKWGDALIESLAKDNCHNVEIYYLRQGNKIADQYYAMSVQLIDDSYSWLVALEDHGTTGGHRDIYVESNDFNSMMKKYYERIIQLSEPVFKDGRKLEVERTRKKTAGQKEDRVNEGERTKP